MIANYAKICNSLVNDLRKDNQLNIKNEKYLNDFNTLKEALQNSLILQLPDLNKPFTLTTDASNFALGAVLS